MEKQNSDRINDLLTLCRQKINGGLGNEALALVFQAAHLANHDISSSLLPSKKNAEEKLHKTSLSHANEICEKLRTDDCILAEEGYEDILVDAFRDGSSVVCTRCGDLISVKRMEAHSSFWCVNK